MTNKVLGAALLVAASLCESGCSTRPVNAPIDRVDPTRGYRPALHATRKHRDDTQILVTFSGGGTRAAAFAYGVLEELRRTQVDADVDPHALIDDVDLLIGVSGGSFTALAYGLEGDQLFEDFPDRFLKRDVQGELIARAANPLHWGTLMSRGGGRSELAADYYDEIVFRGSTFADLQAKPGPYVIATATDISTGARLSFSQADFDMICSDLSSVRLSRAAATSSAVPVVLSPVTFDNHGGHCGYVPPTWVSDVDPAGEPASVGRLRQRLRDIRKFERGDQRPFLHLVDGGVADNLGLRAILERFMEAEFSQNFRSELKIEKLRRTLLIVVNARSDPATNWDRSEDGPGAVDLLLKSISVPIDHESDESLALMRDLMARWKRTGSGPVPAASPKFFAVDVNFDDLPDVAERASLMAISTSFSLPSSEVDHLRTAAARALKTSASFQAFLADLKEKSR